MCRVPKELHLSNTCTFCQKSAPKSISLMEHFKPVKNFKHSSLLKESSVNTQTVPATENLPKPEAAQGFSHLWIKPVWTMYRIQYVEFHRKLRDYICFTAVFWATSQWPWDQPQGQFCHFLICWHMPWVGPVAQLWLSQENSHLCPAHSKGFTRCAVRPSNPIPHPEASISPSAFVSGQPAWEAFLELPGQHMQQQLLALVAKLPKSKRTMGTGELISKINTEKADSEICCAFKKQKLCCFQVLCGWWRKITMLAGALR